MYKKVFFIPLSIALFAMVSCNSANNNNAKTDSSDPSVTAISNAENQPSTAAVAPITRDLDFMIFMHQFANDADFQMSHIKFPLGKLSYAYNMETESYDSFKSCYWLMLDLSVTTKYFTWKNDNKIVFLYNSSMEDIEAEFEYTYTFEKIDGEWYVTQGDYHFSDVGLPEYTKQMAAESQQAFRRNHKGSVEPYVYNGTPGDYPQASERLLTEDDLKGMSKAELRVMRNEIMARHGYTFKSNDLWERFINQGWYYPLFKDVSKNLSDIEDQNVKFIQAHEK